MRRLASELVADVVIEEGVLRFTLIYQGELSPKAKSPEKWRIRRKIEPQLRRLWTLPPINEIAKYKDESYRPHTGLYVGMSIGEIEFIPLISTKLYMRVELRIRLLSASKPGGLLQHSDIDNRLKTLFDALSVPSDQQIPTNPDVGKDARVFCLLENDALVTRVDVSNERLLTEEEHSRNVIVLVEVHPVAYKVTLENIGIAI